VQGQVQGQVQVRSAVHCSAVEVLHLLQCSAVQCSAVQCSAVQCSAVLHLFGWPTQSTGVDVVTERRCIYEQKLVMSKNKKKWPKIVLSKDCYDKRSFSQKSL
jgi:hypothetical protein